MNILTLLNQNIDVPFEKWPSSLLRPLKACSANANGIASSALPPRDGDNAGLATHIRYKVAGATESHNLY